MSAIKARYNLAQMGFSAEKFDLLWAFFRKHGHDGFKGGQHTNGGCRAGRCDYFQPECAAWNELMELLGGL